MTVKVPAEERISRFSLLLPISHFILLSRARDVTSKYPQECTTITQHFQCLWARLSRDYELVNVNLLQALCSEFTIWLKFQLRAGVLLTTASTKQRVARWWIAFIIIHFTQSINCQSKGKYQIFLFHAERSINNRFAKLPIRNSANIFPQL